jgi:hypothetical protein
MDEESNLGDVPDILPPPPDSVVAKKSPRWYEAAALIALSVFCCFPVGLALLWTRKQWTTKSKTIISCVVAASFLFLIVVVAITPKNDPKTDSIASASSETKSSTTTTKSKSTTTEPSTTTTTRTPKETTTTKPKTTTTKPTPTTTTTTIKAITEKDWKSVLESAVGRPNKENSEYQWAQQLDFGIVKFQFVGDENLTDNLTSFGVKREVFKILEKVKSSGYPYGAIAIVACYPYVDRYGNVSINKIAELTYAKGTIERIQFKTIDTNSIYLIADTSDVAAEWR